MIDQRWITGSIILQITYGATTASRSNKRPIGLCASPQSNDQGVYVRNSSASKAVPVGAGVPQHAAHEKRFLQTRSKTMINSNARTTGFNGIDDRIRRDRVSSIEIETKQKCESRAIRFVRQASGHRDAEQQFGGTMEGLYHEGCTAAVVVDRSGRCAHPIGRKCPTAYDTHPTVLPCLGYSFAAHALVE